MAVAFIRQKRGFDKFARQDLRNWELVLERDMKSRPAGLDGATSEISTAAGGVDTVDDVAAGTGACFPVVKKRGRKTNLHFDATVMTKLTYLTVVKARDTARAKAKTRLSEADKLNVQKVKLAEKG